MKSKSLDKKIKFAVIGLMIAFSIVSGMPALDASSNSKVVAGMPALDASSSPKVIALGMPALDA
jgi:hypothetical protein